MNRTKSKNIKEFDAVKFMREQRDRISKEIAHMSPKEILAYLKRNRPKNQIRPEG